MAGIDGKVVLITGASSGIGEATAFHLAGRGARLVLGARRDDRLASIASRIRASGGLAVHAPVDVTRREDLRTLVDPACREFGRLDVFFGNAGIAAISPLDELRVEEWDRMLDVNVRGVLYGIAAALPIFRAQGFGHFVTTLSTSGLKIVPSQAVYAGSKNALRTILECLRQEAGSTLRVTSISPGYVRTNLPASMTNAELREKAERSMAALGIAPEAIARVVAFAIEQPEDVDVSDLVVRPTAQA